MGPNSEAWILHGVELSKPNPSGALKTEFSMAPQSKNFILNGAERYSKRPLMFKTCKEGQTDQLANLRQFLLKRILATQKTVCPVQKTLKNAPGRLFFDHLMF